MMRIAIVNDVLATIDLLQHIVLSLPGYAIAWVAFNGKEAVEKTLLDKPDLILMDLGMPIMGGVEATARIMKNSPCAILIVTSELNKNLSKIFEAMGHGALDVVTTPYKDESGQELLRKIFTIGRLIGKGGGDHKKNKVYVHGSVRNQAPPLIAIGASTGGPMALSKILPYFPKDFCASVVIIQHVDVKFADGFARWLENYSHLPIRLAVHGCFLKAGEILVAGTNDHLIITRNLSMEYTQHPIDVAYRPSVDVFFHSLAKFWPEKSIAVLLTGMGRDGAIGMKTLYEAGWRTIAEHESTCVVYGMPKAAIDIEAANVVLKIDQIGPYILSVINKLNQ